MDTLIKKTNAIFSASSWLRQPILWVGLFFVLTWAAGAQAQQSQPPAQSGGLALELPSLEQWEKLTPQERRAQSKEFRERLYQLTPEQRSQMKAEIRRRFEQLPPGDRERLANQARQDWQAMPAEERARLRDERRAQIERLSPEERKALREERKRLREKLSPEERKRYFQEMPQSRWGSNHRSHRSKEDCDERRPS